MPPFAGMTKGPSVLVATAIALIGTAALWIAIPELLTSWEQKTYDARFRSRGPIEVSPALVLIMRDQESDERFGEGTWDRAIFAEMITGLSQAGAAVIAPDFLFRCPSPKANGGLASDRALLEATSHAGSVIYPVSTRFEDPCPGTAGNGDQTHERFGSFLDTLAQRARGIGHINAEPDSDGLYRSITPFVTIQNEVIPAFGIAAVSAYLNTPPLPEDLDLPLNADGKLLVNYASGWTDVRPLSFVQVWDAIHEKRVQDFAEQVKGKVVLLVHASYQSDKRATPYEVDAPGGFITANVINTLLTHATFHTPSKVVTGLLAIGMALFGAFIMTVSSGWAGVGLVILMLASYVGTSQLLFAQQGLVLPMIIPSLGLFLSAGSAVVMRGTASQMLARNLEQRYQATERDYRAVQDSYAVKQTRVEELEEDLTVLQDQAESATAHSEGMQRQLEAVQRELTKAQAQATQDRVAMQSLQTQLAELSISSARSKSPIPADLVSLQQEAAQVGILSQDRTVLTLFRDLKKAAPSMLTILLLGETGTGKEVFARAVHKLSERRSGPFVAVNMAAIPETLAESEFFGHKKGAFTGADTDKKGFFEQAHGGTLFLDEIGDLDLGTQAKLLRALQEKMFYKIGGTETRVDVRVIAATNADLIQKIKQAKFREDLYHRLSEIQFRLPPLRERRGDIPLLAEHFFEQEKKAIFPARQELKLSEAAIDALSRHPWKGNIRKLQSCLKRTVFMADTAVIGPQDLRFETEGQASSATISSTPRGGDFDIAGDGEFLDCLRAHRFDLQAAADTLERDRTTVTHRFKGICFHALVDHQMDKTGAAAALANDPALAKLVELKLAAYHEHLSKVANQYGSLEEAFKGCRRRFKNLPERYANDLEYLVKHCRTVAVQQPTEER